MEKTYLAFKIITKKIVFYQHCLLTFFSNVLSNNSLKGRSQRSRE